MIINDIEITAPVGSFESLQAAIQAKADSVYFGVEKLNMRAKSTINFTLADLKNIVSEARTNNLKTYLTVNTVIYDEEIPLMQEIIETAKNEGVDAIIASDLAAILFAKKIEMPVHISTQLNVSNIEAVRFYAQFSETIVLARELSLEQIASICKVIEKERILSYSGKPLRIEVFAHGALCMAISGKCYLSLHQHFLSANRGACLQPCRRAYWVKEVETGMEFVVDNQYIMSPKDLCTISFLDKIIESGVKVLKIEGRARPAEYVKTVISCYREAIFSHFEGSFSREKVEKWTEKLSSVFNRGFWGGYYLGNSLGEWSNSHGSKATHRKVYIGKVTNYFSKLHVAEVLLEAGDLQLSDKILITGPTTGVEEVFVSEIRFDLEKVESATRGQTISIPVEILVRRNDKIFRWERV